MMRAGYPAHPDGGLGRLPAEGVLDVGGEACCLCPERALFWPSGRTLVVADTHFGKGAAFRRSGIPVPCGTSAHDASRLDVLIERYHPNQLLFLGDVFHDSLDTANAALVPIRAWRNRHPDLAVAVVTGNHDRDCEGIFEELGFDPVGGRLDRGPFRFVHEADAGPGPYRIAGHVHPGVRVTLAPGERRGFPCFVVGRHRTLLPAFGSFTGLGLVPNAQEDRLYLTVGDRVIGPLEAPTRGAGPMGRGGPEGRVSRKPLKR